MLKVTIHIALIICLVSSCQDSRYPGPLTPEQALKQFQLQHGFQIEIYGSEPHVIDPVDMVFDEFGNVFVVEMLDYPYKPAHGKARSRIRFLQDKNQDGRVDFSTIFQDSLSEATSILPWKSGLIVCAAPQILYLKDTNGDHVADTREVLFTGFFEHNSEAQITNLKFSLDNWVYAANHGNPGKVKYLRKPELPAVSVKGTDFRFRLDKGLFEPAAGSTQFGQAIDKWGQRFSTQNTIHISQIVIPWRYLVRDTATAAKAPVQNISDHDLEMYQLTPPPYWRAERTARRQKQYKEQKLDRIEYADDHFTGCSGGTVYTADLFPKAFQGSIFTGEVAGNLIHRDILLPGEGPLLIAKRDTSEGAQEFLASTDSWFRPANLQVNPDGSLMVIDMYRQHIETPLSIPEDLKENMDFYNGDDMGRIYRIFPVDRKPEKIENYPGRLSSSALVPLLAHRNQWWRLTAQRLLIERQDTTVIPLLKLMALQDTSAVARLHAVFTMDGITGLNIDLVDSLLRDPHQALRIRGIQFAERYPELLPKLLGMVDGASPTEAFQLVLSLGNFNHPEASRALTVILKDYPEDQWFLLAFKSAGVATRQSAAIR